VRVLGISGSLRRDSHNTALLHEAVALLPTDVTIELWDGLKAVPPFDETDEAGPTPVAVADLREAIVRADAVLVATPEYNGSVPGQLKNALDWVSRPYATNPLRGKPVLVVGASTGSFGALWAQADLRRVLGTLGARVLESGVAVPKAHDGLTRELRDRYAQCLGALLAEVPARAAA
jgi:chromate reductase